jgi:diamine N-acetyltransferase
MNQLRLVFLLHAEKIGFLDLYDFNQQNGSAGVGIIVAKKHRQKGYASMAIQHFLKYLAPAFNIHKVFAQVAQNNEISHMLFSKNGFVNETPNESIATFTFYIKTEN